MKTILVDAIYCFVSDQGEIFGEMYNLLEKYPNKKILLTGANDEQIEKWKLKEMPYEFFTLKHNPEKSDPKYYEIMLSRFSLKPEEVIYFEHNANAVKSAESVGIKTYFYDDSKKDLASLKSFLDNNL